MIKKIYGFEVTIVGMFWKKKTTTKDEGENRKEKTLAFIRFKRKKKKKKQLKNRSFREIFDEDVWTLDVCYDVLYLI